MSRTEATESEKGRSLCMTVIFLNQVRVLSLLAPCLQLRAARASFSAGSLKTGVETALLWSQEWEIRWTWKWKGRGSNNAMRRGSQSSPRPLTMALGHMCSDRQANWLKKTIFKSDIQVCARVHACAFVRTGLQTVARTQECVLGKLVFLCLTFSLGSYFYRVTEKEW